MANEKVTALFEEIKNLTILDMNDLVKMLEEEFGVSATAVVAAGGAAAGAAAPAAESAQAPPPQLHLDRGSPERRDKRSEDRPALLPESGDPEPHFSDGPDPPL